MYKKRILEINGDISEISLPIVMFPPFKLRALLIEKDPVVWLHCLETYVRYMRYFIDQNNIEKLDDLTYNNLCAFIKSYLAEMAEDEERLLSLGMNHDVSNQLSLLRTYVFILIKRCGLLHLKIFNESLWDLVKFYVNMNSDSVRALIIGTLKPQINTQKAQLNRIPQIQDHLKHKVESGKFTRVDLKTLEALLNQKTQEPNIFPRQFLTASWLETLDSWWDKGIGKFSKLAKELEVVSLMSTSVGDVCDITKELGISTVETLMMYPLFGSLVTNENFQKKMPELTSKLSFLKCTISNEENGEEALTNIHQTDISTISELFPHLSDIQASQLLRRYDWNVEAATNAVLENPDIVIDLASEETDDDKQIRPENSGVLTTEVELEDATFKERHQSKESTSKRVPDELKNRVLTRALNLLYEKDEDEYDDTYDEADATSSVSRIPYNSYDTESDNKQDSSGASTSQYDQIEGFLWQLLKQDSSLFERSMRGNKSRKDIRQQTGWSDEQIEGWARMLERSPQRAKILETKYMFRGNKKMGKTAYVKNKDADEITNVAQGHSEPVRSKNKPPVDRKRQQTKNEKQKSSRANHNRKLGHDKKTAKAGPV